jgi:hypothetical protein
VSAALQPVMDSVLEEHPAAEPAAQAVRAGITTQVRMALI